MTHHASGLYSKRMNDLKSILPFFFVPLVRFCVAFFKEAAVASKQAFNFHRKEGRPGTMQAWGLDIQSSFSPIEYENSLKYS